MKIKREKTWQLFQDNWCPVCGKTVEMKHIHTGLPGIAAQSCLCCNTTYQANYLEDKDDLLELPENFILP